MNNGNSPEHRRAAGSRPHAFRSSQLSGLSEYPAVPAPESVWGAARSASRDPRGPNTIDLMTGDADAAHRSRFNQVSLLPLLAIIGIVPILLAAPTAAQIGEQVCTYDLSPPHAIASPTGERIVAVTLSVTQCTGEAQAVESTLCLGPADEKPLCRDGYAWQTTQITFGPTPITRAYSAFARGCSVVGNPTVTTCVPLGPIKAVL